MKKCYYFNAKEFTGYWEVVCCDSFRTAYRAAMNYVRGAGRNLTFAAIHIYFGNPYDPAISRHCCCIANADGSVIVVGQQNTEVVYKI